MGGVMFGIGKRLLSLGRGLQLGRSQVELERGQVLLRPIVELTLDAAALARKGINKRGARGRQFLRRGAQCETGEGNGGLDQQTVEPYQQDEEHGCRQPAHDKDQWAIIGGPFADVEFSLRNKRCDHQYARDKTDKDPVGKAGHANKKLQ